MRRPTDQDVELSVAAMLRWGVTVSAAVVFIGGLLYLRHPWEKIPDYGQFRPAAASLRSIPGIIGGAIALNPQSIIQLGLVVLIATPVARVVLCVIGFGRQRNSLYVVVSMAVLIILLYSAISGAR
jgi:uncharacterized membrane protein